MNRTLCQSPPAPARFAPAVVGTFYCIVSALCYTAANICLRKLASLGAEETWVMCNKEVVTVAVIGPWLAAQVLRGRTVLPPPRALTALVLTGLAIQVAGNLPLQWAFGVVGIAIAIPTVFGVMLTASAVLGLVLLKERVSTRSVAAVVLLIVSIVLLGAGVAAKGGVDVRTVDRTVILGVGASCLAGAMFALLSITVRFTATARVPVASIVFVITGMGVLSMSVLSVWRLGLERLSTTPPEQFAWMLAAGASNLVAFLAITKGLQMTTVVRANVLNASQVAMGALAGILLFGESLNLWSMLGVAMTIAGVVLFREPCEEEAELPGV